MALVGIISAGYFLWQRYSVAQNTPLTWDECIKLPNAKTLMTYPEQCVAPDGRRITQSISDAEKKNLQPPIINPNSTGSVGTTNWKTLKNSNGWKIEYPTDWLVYSPGYPPATPNPETDEGVVIQGPNNCFENGQRCGTFALSLRDQTDQASLHSPEQFLLNELAAGSHRKLLAQSETTIGGLPGYSITYNQTNMEFFPNGEIFREIAVGNGNKMLVISINEDYKDRTVIKSIADWKLTPLFDQIISTLKFTDQSATTPPVCNDERFGFPIGEVYECSDFNILMPGGLIMDAPITITDKNWVEITECGGMPGPNGPNSCPEKYGSVDGCKKITCPI